MPIIEHVAGDEHKVTKMCDAWIDAINNDYSRGDHDSSIGCRHEVLLNVILDLH
uniref:Uncharacterized protein n=1 Tax=Oryza sativa subsp. japonica TaxID=39947 RepID=Q84YN3_ORYSJ|nr:hypothetical protein [Oryza sativa Japonica Group]BAD31192.1 hypothetical protein [Oryza sativa Japonica Group]